MTFEGIIHRGFYYNIVDRKLSMNRAATIVDRYGTFEDFFPFAFDLSGFKTASYSVLFEAFKLDFGGFTRTSTTGETFEEYLEWSQNARKRFL